MKGKVIVKGDIQAIKNDYFIWLERKKMYCWLKEIYALNEKQYHKLKQGIIKDGFEEIFRTMFISIENKDKTAKGRILAQYSYPRFLKYK